MSRVLVPEDLPNGDRAVRPLVRAALAVGIAKLDGRAPAAEIARKHWGDDRTVDLVLRAAVSPAGHLAR
jgi:hypothetical protein